MNEYERYQNIEDKCFECVDLFKEWFEGKTMFPITYPEIVFSPLTIDAAQCWYEWDGMISCNGIIVFNSYTIPMNYDLYMNVVAPHETAHYCTALLHGWLNDTEQNENHGIHWNQMMQFFDADPTPTLFNFISPVVEGLTQYGCSCCTINLDNDDIVEYSSELYCYNCECEYKPIKKEVPNEKDNPRRKQQRNKYKFKRRGR